MIDWATVSVIEPELDVLANTGRLRIEVWRHYDLQRSGFKMNHSHEIFVLEKIHTLVTNVTQYQCYFETYFITRIL